MMFKNASKLILQHIFFSGTMTRCLWHLQEAETQETSFCFLFIYKTKGEEKRNNEIYKLLERYLRCKLLKIFCSTDISTHSNSTELFICPINSETIISQSVKCRGKQNQTACWTNREMDCEHHWFLASLFCPQVIQHRQTLICDHLLPSFFKVKRKRRYVLLSVG